MFQLNCIIFRQYSRILIVYKRWEFHENWFDIIISRKMAVRNNEKLLIWLKNSRFLWNRKYKCGGSMRNRFFIPDFPFASIVLGGLRQLLPVIRRILVRTWKILLRTFVLWWSSSFFIRQVGETQQWSLLHQRIVVLFTFFLSPPLSAQAARRREQASHCGSRQLAKWQSTSSEWRISQDQFLSIRCFSSFCHLWLPARETLEKLEIQVLVS